MIRLRKDDDGIWLIVEGKTKRACILLDTKSSIVKAALEEVLNSQG